jgi:hypothetical protein
MACVQTLKQAPDMTWTGTSANGQTITFNTLSEYRRFTQSLANCPQVQPWSKAVDTQESGFGTLAPRDPGSQARFDAMSPSWEGVSSSDKAVVNGVYSLDSAAATRVQLRSATPAPPVVPTPTYCVVQ